ncbi:MAG: nickel-dependent lactate racemase [Anaerolineae bacterium]|nr:nickel-dependent lactate racemase [Anaerolineae bacterium]MDW8072484.1 nickel-dependent lactate racemase [Anaerolineae bacterium]
MMGVTYHVPFGRGELEFTLVPSMQGTLLESKKVPPLAVPAAAIREALANPSGCAPLRRLARPGDRVCLVFTDATRACPDALLVSALLEELHAAGVRDEHITLLCGTGLHRPSTVTEKIAKLGMPILERYRVVDHSASDSAELAYLGTTASGAPIWINRLVVESDLVIATGVVEPHLYAGYSGGVKTVAVGAAGEPTIAYTHSALLSDHPNTRLGCIEGNPFHQTLCEIAQRAGLRFILNVLLDDQERILAVRAGDPVQAFRELVTLARTLYEVPVERQYDLVIAGVGHPKDANFYQATRAATYVFRAPRPVLKPGGCIIVPAPCPEGVGRGSGEQRFYEIMRSARDVATLLADMRRTGYPAGAQRAYFLAQVLLHHKVIIVGAEHPDLVRHLHMIPARTMEEALQFVVEAIGRPDLEVLIMPHALHTLPGEPGIEPVHVAVGTVRLQLRRRGQDPATVDGQGALHILEELSHAEPELPASKWYVTAQPEQLAQFTELWESLRC